MEESILINWEQSKAAIEQLINELFPIHRTLVNNGYKQSLEIINNQLPIAVSEIPSGKEVFDWVIPKSWNVICARILDVDGNVLIDFANNNLHLSAYSQSFNGTVTHNELLEHINFREDLSDAIPYNFHYYKNNWSFNVTYNDWLKNFKSTEYKIEIKTEVFDDFLRIGEYYLQGESEKEILLTSYLCHPSMVNDNLSGVVVVTELFKYLKRLTRRKYSYRLIIIPETIGAITYISEYQSRMKNVIGGVTVYCCGIGKKVVYKSTYSGISYIDKMFNYVFKHFFPEESSILPFWPGGSDERQFNGTGLRFPMGALTRTPAAEFIEYHTSLDNLDLMDINSLVDTLEKLSIVVNAIEVDRKYKNNYFGEPCFSRHNIKYPTFNDALEKSAAYIVKILSNEIDGGKSLLEIAEKWNLNIFHLSAMAKEFEMEGLIIEIE